MQDLAVAGVYRIGTEIIDYSPMKSILIILLAAALFTTPSASGQQPDTLQTRPAGTFEQQNPTSQEQNLVKFDLDFPGGTPKQLVEAIEKSSGQPLNAVIPDPYADLKLPPLKMRGVNVGELFGALQLASAEHMQYISGNTPGGGPQYSVFNGSSGLNRLLRQGGKNLVGFRFRRLSVK